MDILGLALVLLFAGLMVGFSVLNRRLPGMSIRQIPAFSRLRRAVDLAVEDGSRLHVSLGHADITGPNSAAALVALSMLSQITRTAADSDQPPVASAGNGTLALLAQDTLRSTYKSMGALNNYSNTLGRVTGLTPFSYAAGTFPIIRDEDVSANLLVGSFGSEVAFISTAGGSRQVLTLAGTDTLPAQAVLYATADELLVGEELYAGGAYVGAGPMHIASLHAQDIVRWILIAALALSSLGALFDIIR